MKNSNYDKLNILRCPNCLSALADNSCTECATAFNQVLGILDLRWPQVTYSYSETTQIEQMVKSYNTVSFSELVAIRFQGSDLPYEIRMDYERYAANPNIRSRKMLNMFWQKVTQYYPEPQNDVALDLGCGVGASSKILATQFEYVVGVDVDIISLILAKKYLEENGVDNVLLIQAYAQKLPLRNRFVTYTMAQNVLEHLFEVEVALREVKRVMRVSGCFCGDSRNRYDLLFKEPHAKLRWVGFWPRRRQAWYVKRFRQITYDHTHLLSLTELKRFAQNVFGSSITISFPSGAAYDRSDKWDRLINVLGRVPIINWLALFFFPSHLLLAQVNEDNHLE